MLASQCRLHGIGRLVTTPSPLSARACSRVTRRYFVMSKGNPAEEGNAELAISLAETEAAAYVEVGTTDDGSGLDEYDELLASLGRTEGEDERIVVHEAGHAVCARLLGHPLGGATVDPDPNGKYGGLVWGPRHSVAFGDDGDDVPEICDKLRDVMPQD